MPEVEEQPALVLHEIDMSNPNMDGYLHMMPSCPGIDGHSDEDISSTSLGILIDEGANIIDNYKDSLIKRKEVSKHGYLDYMSGIYHRVDETKLLKFDYNSLFNKLSMMYDYIVIDFGKLGYRDIKDSLIKRVVTSNDVNSVCLTINDIFKVRNLINQIEERSMVESNILMVLNYCNSTNIDKKLKGILNRVNYGVLINDDSIRMDGMNFVNTANKIVRSQFDDIVKFVMK